MTTDMRTRISSRDLQGRSSLGFRVRRMGHVLAVFLATTLAAGGVAWYFSLSGPAVAMAERRSATALRHAGVGLEALAARYPPAEDNDNAKALRRAAAALGITPSTGSANANTRMQGVSLKPLPEADLLAFVRSPRPWQPDDRRRAPVPVESFLGDHAPAISDCVAACTRGAPPAWSRLSFGGVVVGGDGDPKETFHLAVVLLAEAKAAAFREEQVRAESALAAAWQVVIGMSRSLEPECHRLWLQALHLHCDVLTQWPGVAPEWEDLLADVEPIAHYQDVLGNLAQGWLSIGQTPGGFGRFASSRSTDWERALLVGNRPVAGRLQATSVADAIMRRRAASAALRVAHAIEASRWLDVCDPTSLPSSHFPRSPSTDGNVVWRLSGPPQSDWALVLATSRALDRARLSVALQSWVAGATDIEMLGRAIQRANCPEEWSLRLSAGPCAELRSLRSQHATIESAAPPCMACAPLHASSDRSLRDAILDLQRLQAGNEAGLVARLIGEPPAGRAIEAYVRIRTNTREQQEALALARRKECDWAAHAPILRGIDVEPGREGTESWFAGALYLRERTVSARVAWLRGLRDELVAERTTPLEFEWMSVMVEERLLGRTLAHDDLMGQGRFPWGQRLHPAAQPDSQGALASARNARAAKRVQAVQAQQLAILAPWRTELASLPGGAHAFLHPLLGGEPGGRCSNGPGFTEVPLP